MAHGEEHGEADCPPEPVEDHVGTDNHLQPMDVPMLEQVEMPWRKLQPVVIDHFITHGIEFDHVHLYKDISDAKGDIHVKEVIYKWIEKDLERG